MLAMGRYGGDLPGGFAIKSYGDGLYMIKSTNASSGRCLFFTIHRLGGVERLVALLFYKKESDEAPTRLVAVARERRGRYLEEQ